MTLLIRDPRARAEAVEQWANLNGDALEAFWPDDETRWVIENALWCAGDVLNLLPADAPTSPVFPVCRCTHRHDHHRDSGDPRGPGCWRCDCPGYFPDPIARLAS